MSKVEPEPWKAQKVSQSSEKIKYWARAIKGSKTKTEAQRALKFEPEHQKVQKVSTRHEKIYKLSLSLKKFKQDSEPWKAQTLNLGLKKLKN